jgi:ABC-type glycerol-3-phosphate transport system permease component
MTESNVYPAELGVQQRKRRVARAHRTPGRLMQGLGMALLALSAVFPLYFMVSGSFRTQDNWNHSEIGLPTTSSLNAFREAWHTASLGVYLRNSLIVTSGTVVLSLLIAAMAGYAFSHLRWRLRGGAYFFLIAWLAVPPIALLIPVYEEMIRFGLINTYWSVILLYAALNTPFNVYLMTSYLRGISGEFCEAARMDGANVHEIFGGVILPLSIPALATLAVFNFLYAWNEFIFALLLLQPDSVKTATVGVLQLQGRLSVNYPELAAGLLITSLPVIGVYLFFQRYLVRAIVAGGVK